MEIIDRSITSTESYIPKGEPSDKDYGRRKTQNAQLSLIIRSA
jgi:hypothetical protein